MKDRRELGLRVVYHDIFREMSETIEPGVSKAYRGSLRGAMRGLAQGRQKLTLKHFINPFLLEKLPMVQGSSLAGLRGACSGGMTSLLLPPMASAKTALALMAGPSNPPVHAEVDTTSGELSLRSLASQLGGYNGSWSYFTGPRCDWGQALLEQHPAVPVVADGSVADWRLPPVLAWGFLYLMDRRWGRIWHHTITVDPRGPRLQLPPVPWGGARVHPLERADAQGPLVGPQKRLLGVLEGVDAAGPYEAEQLLDWRETGGRVVLIGDLVVESIAFGD